MNMFDIVTESFNASESKDVTPAGKKPILNDEMMDMLALISFGVLASPICIFGIFANIVNIIVFFKQGFKNTVNITLFGIAFSDLGAVITVLWMSICFVPLFRYSDVPFVTIEIEYLTGGLPHVFFSRVTSSFIAFVTIERCLSVTMPLRVKRLVTPRRTVVALVFLVTLNFLSFLPEYVENYWDWDFVEERNKTLVRMIKTQYTGSLAFILTPACGLIALVIVTVSTVVLVIQLQRKSKWRETFRQGASVSTRDKSTMKIVIVLASILIACNIPGLITTPVSILEPEFRVTGAYFRLFNSVWIYNTMFQAANSSVNILFYYRMSTKYREGFYRLFPAFAEGFQEE